MDFFDKLTKKATETYKGAAEKTGKIAKEAKLKMKINDNKSKIDDLYQEIGKKVYQKHTANEDLCIKKDLEDECAKIDILSSEIDSYHKEILDLSDIKACINCKETIAKEAKFCPNCGVEQPNEENAKREIEVEIIEQEQNNTEEEIDEGCAGSNNASDGKMNYTEGEDTQNKSQTE